MSAIDQLARQFQRQSLERGLSYFRDGSVSSIVRIGSEIRARVQGRETYDVRLDVANLAQPEMGCTCPWNRDTGEPCKHVWAVLLSANERGLLDVPNSVGSGAKGGNGLNTGGWRPASSLDISAADRDDSDDVFDDEAPDDAEAEESSVSEEENDARESAAPPPGEARGGSNDDDEDDGTLSRIEIARSLRAPSLRAEKLASIPTWKRKIHELHAHLASAAPVDERRGAWPPGRRVVYVIEVEPAAHERTDLTLEVMTQSPGRGTAGVQWLAPKRLGIDELDWLAVPDENDRQIANLLIGATGGHEAFYPTTGAKRFHVPPHAYDLTLKMICDTGKCFLRAEPSIAFEPLTWDGGEPWEFALDIRAHEELVDVHGLLRRGENEAMPLAEPALLLADGLMIARGRIARLRHHGAWAILGALRKGLEIKAPVQRTAELVRELYALPRVPPIVIPADAGITDVVVIPKPRLHISRPSGTNVVRGADRLTAELSFDYDGHVIPVEAEQAAVFEENSSRVIRRDRAAETMASRLLTQLGFRHEWDSTWDGTVRSRLHVPMRKLPAAVARLASEGWRVEADGKLYRRAGKVDVRVSSGIDWFELTAAVDFDGQRVPLPRLLRALRKGQDSIVLDDGTLGLLPEEWLRKYAPLAALGSENEAADDANADAEAIRFTAAQVGFLDVLLAEMPEASVDEQFEHARDALRQFEGIDSVEAPTTFSGELRPYQRDGLGWLMFLQRMRFGGCLADDMGLGKTVQVLALLETRRLLKSGPSLVVVPRSLVFNWVAEASRFTPTLRVLDHSGALRRKTTEHFDEFDLIVTTYGTLRRDAGLFRDVTFDYVILDEAQAIKNAGTESAKAARLLRGNHRLAMSGTPIENHLGELWSLFEFLNPGMMGASDTLKILSTAVGPRPTVSSAPASDSSAELASSPPEASASSDESLADSAATSTEAAVDEDPDLEAEEEVAREATDSRQLLARALRPFILRRTKGQVARELPEKLEQTIFCEMEPPQRKLYDELRDHYRQSLFQRIEEVGLNKSKMHVLEALLRLRQAACHPGLVDKTRVGEPSAKLDALLEQISEVVEEGHKVLVFSQFTSMLAIVRDRLDKQGMPYEYLDGRTRDRQARVERFQTDTSCKLFLISLKAGGLGLNLTAADYVYLLDPWWNPAVEAQAIDRAHRIGQEKPVFAYRLIARGTVEEKVLELQRTKRELADAIITADNSMIASLGREELEMLLA